MPCPCNELIVYDGLASPLDAQQVLWPLHTVTKHGGGAGITYILPTLFGWRIRLTFRVSTVRLWRQAYFSGAWCSGHTAAALRDPRPVAP